MRAWGMVLVSLIGPLLRWLLRSLRISARTRVLVLGRVLSWVLTRMLGTVRLWLMLRRLLRVVTVRAGSLVIGPAPGLRVMVAPASSSRMATTTTLALIWGILWIATRR